MSSTYRRNGNSSNCTAPKPELSFDMEAEVAVIGSLLIDPEAFDEVGAVLRARDFFHAPHRVIYQAVSDLRGKGEPADIITLYDWLESQGKLEDAGGIATVSNMANAVPTSANAKQYARVVLKHAIRRTHYSLAEVHAAISQREDAEIMAKLARGQALLADLERRLAGDRKDSQARKPLKLMSVKELRMLPLPSPLIDHILVKSGISMWNGPSQAGKSLAIADAACRVALGQSWMGFSTVQGPVVYIAAEGGAGMRLRIEAWMQEHQIEDIPNLYVLPQAMQMLDAADVEEFLTQVASIPQPPVWIIADTVSQTSMGADENSNTDMARYVNVLAHLRDVTGAHVTMVHHNDKAGTGFRGAGALFNNVDTVVEFARDGDTSRISCKKQRDGWEPFRSMAFQIKQVAFDNYGDITSAVIVPCGVATSAPTNRMSESQRTALLALYNHPDRLMGLPSKEWERAAMQPHSTFQDARGWLVKVSIVRQLDGSGNYILSPNGLRLVQRLAGGDEDNIVPFPGA